MCKEMALMKALHSTNIGPEIQPVRTDIKITISILLCIVNSKSQIQWLPRLGNILCLYLFMPPHFRIHFNVVINEQDKEWSFPPI